MEKSKKRQRGGRVRHRLDKDLSDKVMKWSGREQERASGWFKRNGSSPKHTVLVAAVLIYF